MYTHRYFAPLLTQELVNREFHAQTVAPQPEAPQPAGAGRPAIHRQLATVGTHAELPYGQLYDESLLTLFLCRAHKRGAERPTVQPPIMYLTSSYSLAIFPSSLPTTSAFRPAFMCPDLCQSGRANNPSRIPQLLAVSRLAVSRHRDRRGLDRNIRAIWLATDWFGPTLAGEWIDETSAEPTSRSPNHPNRP